MKVLLTGATGYIGKRLLPVLIEKGHHVVCCVRDKKRFTPKSSLRRFIDVIEIDLLDKKSLKNIPEDIDAAYYLVHSMSTSKKYQSLEETSAINFREALSQTTVKQVIYLSGIVNDKKLSRHLNSRKNVEDKLSKGNYALTVLRAGIIIGSGSASFEIIRDLIEKLPFMIAPRWINTKCQPIGVTDVIKFLTGVLLNPDTYSKNFDIGGPDILSYKEMLLTYANVRRLKRYIITFPFMTPRISSYWLYFVTSTSYKLACALVESMNVEVITKNNTINELLNIKPISYLESLKKTFATIEENDIISSWKDAFISGQSDFRISEFLNVPTFGCLIMKQQKKYNNKEKILNKIWCIGGDNGWYYANWLWNLRGLMDKIVGGVGLRRGRTNPQMLSVGDAVDFWRVLYANKEEGRLLLFAEMKLPGEAWLEFDAKDGILTQIATFRPLGIHGRLYWYIIYPIHKLVFNGMLNKLAK